MMEEGGGMRAEVREMRDDGGGMKDEG